MHNFTISRISHLKNIGPLNYNNVPSWVPVAHTCNPGYSGDRDQEDHSSKPAQANSPRDPISKKNYHKKGLVEWLKV
jgi:hypothetical protein